MLDLDRDLARRHYDDKWWELASLFRSLSLSVQDDRNVILRYLDRPHFEQVYADRRSSCFDRACMYEALSYGDPGVLLSCPGPSLSGIVLRELGTPEQQDHFFERVAHGRMRTCMAVTEPDKGSDAGHPTATLDADGMLRGEKWLVGNGRDAGIGTLVARTGPGPYNVSLLLLTPEVLNHASLSRRLLPVVGLIGAGLSHLCFDGVPIARESILGLHRRPLERGMHAVIQTFYRMRPCVSAMALGSAQALLDFSLPHLGNALARERHGALQLQVDAARALNRQAAKRIDQGVSDGAAVSLAKACATGLVEKVAASMPSLVGSDVFLMNDWLRKTMSDIHGYEWMEGSLDMQRLNILSGFLQSVVRRGNAGAEAVCRDAG